MTDLQAALQEKQTAEHSVIDEAIADRGDVSLLTLSSSTSPC